MLMMSKMSGMLSTGGDAVVLRPQDVFSTTLYTGTTGDKDLNTGVNLAAGGMLWIKQRNASGSHYLMDSERGVARELYSNSTAGEALTGNVGSFTAVGAYLNGGVLHTNGNTYAAWSFREAPKFFDVVKYTGDNNGGRQIPHTLGVQPGMVIVKRIDGSGDWGVRHRRNGASDGPFFALNTTQAAIVENNMNTAASSSTFSPGQFQTSTSTFNTTGEQYIAYLFAHDPSVDGVVQCGGYTGNGSASGPTITLGWQPQFVIVKSASTTGEWVMIDSARATSNPRNKYFFAESNSAENTFSLLNFTSTGFSPVTADSTVNTNGATYVYLAIRAAA